MLKTLAVAGFLILGAADAYVFGQTPPSPPDPQTLVARRVSFLASQLSLTDAQKTSATTIFTNAATAAQTLQSSLQTNRQAMADAVKSNDIASIDSLALTSGSLSGQLTAIERRADAAFYAILTADQQAKYAAQPPGPGGPGGTRGPGAMGRRGPPIQ